MPDILDASGLTVKTLSDLVAQLNAAYISIYGADINLDQNSPDGQRIGIEAQAAEDIRELAMQIYNSFNPDRAIGRALDERVAINNIQRLGGTFTIVPITIVNDRTITLAGLDASFNDVNGTGYTIQDNAGTKFILVDTTTLTSGTTTLNFRAQKIGQVETTIATITTPVTIVLGVVSVNNASGALQTGQNEETDAQLRVRRQYSVALASQGYLNGLLGAVLNLDGVTDAKIYENVTNSTDGNGIPAHGIWLIVEGGANSDIGNLIYTKKSYGANMKGAVTVNITTASGAIFTAKFDRPQAANLYIRFNIQKTLSTASFDLTAIKQYMVDNINYGIGQYAETSSLTALAKLAIDSVGGGGVPVDLQISDDGITYVDYKTVPQLNDQWVVDTTRISVTVL